MQYHISQQSNFFSDLTKEDLSVDSLSKDVIKIVEMLEVENTVLVGHSMRVL